MIISKLGFGPMSTEIIEAIFRISNYHRKQLMIIPSKNQIDYNGGYVNNWTTKEFTDFVKEMKQKYPQSDILLCRDHCGPGFNGIYNLEDTYNTIKEDIKCGFDLIHIDFCHFKGSSQEKLQETRKAIEYCLNLNPKIMLEVGTDENLGSNFSIPSLMEIQKEIDYIKTFCNPEFYVVQTGSLVKEINQAGNFNRVFIEKIHDSLKSRGVKLKEHNADYLSAEEIQLRQGVVDAMNIAPQLGVVQTMVVLKKCLIYGVDFTSFTEEVYKGNKWRKWLDKNTQENKFLCTIIAGHYHFPSESYKNLIKELEKREDIKETIINEIMEVINHYGQNTKSNS